MPNIEGAIRMDDARIPESEALDGVVIVGMKNGQSVRVNAELMRSLLTPAQLTPDQKERVRDNIGALSSEAVSDGTNYREVVI